MKLLATAKAITHSLVVVSALSASCLMAGKAVAADYPERSIRMIVAFSAGGAADSVARPLAQKLGQILGQTVVVDNRPGGNGNIGLTEVARAKADGYTLTLNPSNFAINPHLYEKLPYDTAKDFTPLGLVAKGPLVLLVNKDFPAKTVSEFVAHARANPKNVTFANAAVGGASHLAQLVFNKITNTDILMIPYKGNAPALNDVIGGQVSAMFDPAQTGMAQVKAGRLRALAVTGERRLPDAPDVPTAIESGLPDFRFYSWYAVFGPANLPAPVQKRLEAALQQAIHDPEVQNRLKVMGMEPSPLFGTQLKSFITAESELYRGVIEDARIPKQ